MAGQPAGTESGNPVGLRPAAFRGNLPGGTAADCDFHSEKRQPDWVEMEIACVHGHKKNGSSGRTPISKIPPVRLTNALERQSMAKYSRKTVLAATDLLENAGHARITRFLLEHGLENENIVGSMRDRASGVARHLLADPDRLDDDEQKLTDGVVEDIVNGAIQSFTPYDGRFDCEGFSRTHGALSRALAGDGFMVENGRLRRTLPQELDLPQADDEVHALLELYHLEVTLGHLNQAIAAHTRGDWAAANAQLRAFVESLFDGIAERLAGHLRVVVPVAGNQRRIWLAQLNPSFFSHELNEWTGQGTGFLEAFFRRLHPQGAHPGLSDEEDSTFRLHWVLLTARPLLKRLEARLR